MKADKHGKNATMQPDETNRLGEQSSNGTGKERRKMHTYFTLFRLIFKFVRLQQTSKISSGKDFMYCPSRSKKKVFSADLNFSLRF
jgi:hypothetical protein